METLNKSFLNLADDWRLYRRLVVQEIRGQMQYKVHMLTDFVSTALLFALEFCAVLFFFQAFPSLLGWHVGEVILLNGTVSMGLGAAQILGAGIDNFSEMIRLGEFDRLLLRPASLLIQVAGSDFTLRRAGRAFLGLCIFLLGVSMLTSLHWTVLKWLVLGLGVCSGILLFTAILLLGATVCFWTVETTELVSLFFFGGSEMLRYPLAIYSVLFQSFFLFVIPIAFGSYVPICYILNRPLPFGLPSWLAFCSPVVGLLFLLAAVALWRIGVKHYQSTGS